MKKRYVLGLSGLMAVAAAQAFDSNSKRPGLTWNQQEQDIVFTPAGAQTRVTETATGNVQTLDCPIHEVRLVDQYKVLFPLPFPVINKAAAYCGKDVAGPGKSALIGVGRIVGLDHL